MSNRVKECIIRLSPFEKIDTINTNVSKSICKLKIENGANTISGTGFLLKLYIDQEFFYYLISNEHVIKQNIINNNIIIYIYYDKENKVTNIKLDTTKRYIKSFIDIGLDITVIEILDEDNISEDYFLYPESNIIINNKLINSKIYIIQYVNGEELMNAKGYIKDINKYDYTHLDSTQYSSSGNPIFLENSVYVIGIHKQSDKDKTKIMVILFIL